MSELLGQLSPPLLLAAAWLLLTAESGLLIGVALPGTSVLVALGYFAHLGVVPLGGAVGVAASAAVTGTHLSYLWGRRREGADSFHRFAPGRWDRTRDLLGRHGSRTVVAGQWFGSARTLTPRLAGWAGMPYRTFATASLPTACAWAATLVTLSYHVAPEIVQQFTSHLSIAGPAAVVLALLLLWATRLLRKRQAGRAR
ncbi:DedA family protein [Nonomuraea pusilla]|uniref:Membrane protein DedA, SNARE-associated domain n=1 Tax=Nonomuraea pusilla TaxID=46177 RepID=A0A1H7QCI9_9ACTN|nr:VTT domain-containing protein [Nonomuraea pusilla]SEL45871.1 membrane protein DedA, SNARE-associated domain [Nonomuraea pusilla]